MGKKEKISLFEDMEPFDELDVEECIDAETEFGGDEINGKICRVSEDEIKATLNIDGEEMKSTITKEEYEEGDFDF